MTEKYTETYFLIIFDGDGDGEDTRFIDSINEFWPKWFSIIVTRARIWTILLQPYMTIIAVRMTLAFYFLDDNALL